MIRRLAPWVLLLAACSGSSAGHERLGDDAIAQSDYPLAVAEYQAAAQGSARSRVLAKLGNAALHAGDYRQAVDAYQKLGELDPSRLPEAVSGLERAAQAAQHDGDAVAVRAALVVLRSLAPERPAGRLAVPVALGGQLGPAEAINLIPYALAGAPDDATVDSLLGLYGDAFRRTTACEDAVRIYQAVIRRAGLSTSPAVRDGLAACALQLGEDAETLKEPGIAERWYRTAARADSTSDAGRRALVGLGDARAAQGDSTDAMRIYQQVLDLSGPGDSLGQLATQRLLAVGSGQVIPDSAVRP